MLVLLALTLLRIMVLSWSVLWLPIRFLVMGEGNWNTGDEAGGREPYQCTHTQESSPGYHSILPFDVRR